MQLVSSEGSFHFKWARQGSVVDGKGTQQKMEAKGKKNPIYISEVTDVPSCTSYSRRQYLCSDKY